MRVFIVVATIATVSLVGCTAPLGGPSSALTTIERPCCQSAGITPDRSAVVKTATKLVGAKTITSRGRRIAYDCAGVTRAIFLEHGIDLYDGATDHPKANGVKLIFEHVRRHGMLHRSQVVDPGDLVFFDNTWDLNGDGHPNDPLTHVGVVERLEPDGTVVFISRVTDAIERYRMNLGRPHVHKAADGRVLNDYLRRKSPADPDGMHHLTGELFSSYGTRLNPLRSSSNDQRR